MTTVHVRVGTSDAGPVDGLQRLALCSPVAFAKFRECVHTARVISIRELVHAIAGLQECGGGQFNTQERQVPRASVNGSGPGNRTRKETTSNHHSQGRTTSACTHLAVAFTFRPESDDALAWII